MATATLPVPPVPAVHFRNLLFATDFSEYSRQALPYATDLARRFNSSVYLCHVVTPSQLVIGAPEAVPYLYEAQHQRGTQELADIIQSAELKGLKTKAILASGL